MIGTNDSSGANPKEETNPNWDWLQEKIPPAQVALLDDWMDVQLIELEEDFAEFVTQRSLCHSIARSR